MSRQTGRIHSYFTILESFFQQYQFHAPDAAGRGFGKQFVAFYEDYAIQNGCKVLRMDTNSRNLRARAMYGRLGYREAGIVPCVFNGIAGVALVLLEKMLNNL